MANVVRVYNVANIWQSPVDVYVNIAAPASASPPVSASQVVLDALGQPSSATGFHLGSTEGPTSIQITEKTNEILDDQHESPIDVAFDDTSAEVDITMKESSLTKLQTMLTSGGLGAYTVLANSQALQIGGQLDCSISPLTLLLVSVNRAVAGKFLYALAYKCYLKSAIAIALSMSKETVYKLKFGCVMDLTRVTGDELMQIVRTK